MTPYEYGFLSKCAESGVPAEYAIGLMQKCSSKLSPGLLEALETAGSKLTSVNGHAPSVADAARFAKEQDLAKDLISRFVRTNRKALSRKGGHGRKGAMRRVFANGDILGHKEMLDIGVHK